MGNSPPSPRHTEHYTVFYIENRHYLDAFYNCDNGLHTPENSRRRLRRGKKNKQPKVCTIEEYDRIVKVAMNILGGPPSSLSNYNDLKQPDMFTYPFLYNDYNTIDNDWKVSRKLADLQTKLRIEVRKEYIYNDTIFVPTNGGHYVHIITIKRRRKEEK